MPSPDTRESMRDFPPVVYVPCTRSRTEWGPAGQVALEILMRMTRDGRIALLAYSALDRSTAWSAARLSGRYSPTTVSTRSMRSNPLICCSWMSRFPPNPGRTASG